MASLFATLVATEVLGRSVQDWDYELLPNPMTHPEECNLSRPGWFCDPDFLIPRHHADGIAEAIVDPIDPEKPRLVFVLVHNDLSAGTIKTQEQHDEIAAILEKQAKGQMSSDYNPLSEIFPSIVTKACDLQTRYANEWHQTSSLRDYQLIIMTHTSLGGCRAYDENLNYVMDAIGEVSCLGRNRGCQDSVMEDFYDTLRVRVEYLREKGEKLARAIYIRDRNQVIDTIIVVVAFSALIVYQLRQYYLEGKMKGTRYV